MKQLIRAEVPLGVKTSYLCGNVTCQLSERKCHLSAIGNLGNGISPKIMPKMVSNNENITTAIRFTVYQVASSFYSTHTRFLYLQLYSRGYRYSCTVQL